jgi:hypothetical protein
MMIKQSRLTVLPYKHIFRLQVSVQNLFAVEMSESKSDLSSEELGLFFLEPLDTDQVSEQFAPFDELHQEVDAVFVLEDVLHVDQEGMVNGVQYIFFKLNVIHLLVLKNNIFANALHSIQLPWLAFVLHKIHFPKRALADQLQYLEVLQTRICFVPTEHSL